jgi:hypothetical protein
VPPGEVVDCVHTAVGSLQPADQIERIGVNAEYLPARHHGIMVNPFVQFTSAGSDALKTSYTNFGGELGYHYYTGTKGANGFFIGPSAIVMVSNSTTTANISGQSSQASTSTTAFGGALDLGGQHVFDNGFTIGGGVGVMYLVASTSDNQQTSSTAKVAGVLPRVLFTVGYSL